MTDSRNGQISQPRKTQVPNYKISYANKGGATKTNKFNYKSRKVKTGNQEKDGIKFHKVVVLNFGRLQRNMLDKI